MKGKAQFYKKAESISDLRSMTKEEAEDMIQPLYIENTTQSGIDHMVGILTKEKEHTPYTVMKTIELTAKAYDKFTSNFFADQKFIKENKDWMWWGDDGIHCIAVTSKKREWVILVDSQGYDYARYTAKVAKEK